MICNHAHQIALQWLPPNACPAFTGSIAQPLARRKPRQSMVRSFRRGNCRRCLDGIGLNSPSMDGTQERLRQTPTACSKIPIIKGDNRNSRTPEQTVCLRIRKPLDRDQERCLPFSFRLLPSPKRIDIRMSLTQKVKSLSTQRRGNLRRISPKRLTTASLDRLRSRILCWSPFLRG